MHASADLPRFACPDWWDKIQRGETPMADVPLNQVKAAKVLAFFNRLRLPDVPGNPPMAEACGDWFKDILCAFLASEDPQTRERLVWECLCMVPKKNSKSTYTAALGLTALFMEEAPNRQMLLIGPSQNISDRCFDQAQAMIRLDPKLDAVFRVQDHLKIITRRKTGTKLEVMTFDPSIVTGEIPVLTIIDEVHELGKKRAAQSVMQQIRGGGITMQGGQVMMITTQSDERPAGIWKTELEKARSIRDGKGGASPIMLPVLYEFPIALQLKETFWRDRRNWPLVLPNLGLSISRQRLEDDYDNNGKITPEAERIWVSQHLNIQIGVGLSGDMWPGALYWQRRAVSGLTLDEIMQRCDVCTVGVDGGGLDDLFGLAVIGREKVTRNWLVWAKAWAQDDVYERRKDIVTHLEGFEADGDLIRCTENLQDANEAAEICMRLWDAGLLPEQAAIGVDASGMAIADFADVMISKGMTLGKELVQVGQGYKLQTAILALPRKLKYGTMHHAGQPLMDWCVGNAKTELKGSVHMVTKQAAGSAKIDPLMALFDAAQLMFLDPTAQARQVTPWDADPNFRLAV